MILNVIKANEEIKRLTSEVENLQAERASISQENQRLQSERDEAVKCLESATEALKKSNSDLESLSAKIAEVEASVEKRANVKAQEIVAQVGLSAPVAEAKPDAPKNLIEQFQAITDPGERYAFYRKHACDLPKAVFEKRN